MRGPCLPSRLGTIHKMGHQETLVRGLGCGTELGASVPNQPKMHLLPVTCLHPQGASPHGNMGTRPFFPIPVPSSRPQTPAPRPSRVSSHDGLTLAPMPRRGSSRRRCHPRGYVRSNKMTPPQVLSHAGYTSVPQSPHVPLGTEPSCFHRGSQLYRTVLRLAPLSPQTRALLPQDLCLSWW